MTTPDSIPTPAMDVNVTATISPLTEELLMSLIVAIEGAITPDGCYREVTTEDIESLRLQPDFTGQIVGVVEWIPVAGPDSLANTLEAIGGRVRGAVARWARQAVSTTTHVKPSPPLPTPTPSLDELLTPDGGYELDAKHVHPSAQHIDGKWWAPRFGSESLSIAMDDIRYRIIPYLRPPVVGIDLPGPDGDYAEIADLCRAEGVPIEAGARLLRRARAAWDSNRIPLTPLLYGTGDGYRIFTNDRSEHDWQVSRYTKSTDDLYTAERLFVSGEWSRTWHADNTSEYTFPTATAAWEALKKWQEGGGK